MNESILIVDDEKEIADLIEVYLKNDGYTVHKFYNGLDALECIETQKMDLAILDVMLPDIDGFRICQKIREQYYYPIIMLTAKVEDTDKIMGLTIGADDYIIKPFDSKELVARVRAVLRRFQPKPTAVVSDEKCASYPDLTVNLTNYSVTYMGKQVDMPPKELELLYFLAATQSGIYKRAASGPYLGL